ncbi:hypothetical protein [Mesorhizobium sp. B1-1-8]|uniref:hypothetical protein n=1 Tax=Mesorhizobium sp. B1-1-8 TaxID=2589976 RepID=UPI00112BA15B|nr:hypothetical protein [Mesorhizobium sp. B1-1-8]UCI09524.1 hypothetical protein FJ974_10910 [Mesorhizobium sp. B1-1-8]
MSGHNQVAQRDDICTDRNFTPIRRVLEGRGLSCRTRAVIAIWENANSNAACSASPGGKGVP